MDVAEGFVIAEYFQFAHVERDGRKVPTNIRLDETPAPTADKISVAYFDRYIEMFGMIGTVGGELKHARVYGTYEEAERALFKIRQRTGHFRHAFVVEGRDAQEWERQRYLKRARQRANRAVPRRSRSAGSTVS